MIQNFWEIYTKQIGRQIKIFTVGISLFKKMNVIENMSIFYFFVFRVFLDVSKSKNLNK